MKRCPVCNIPMDETPKSGILIDVCPKCRGMWFDRGELNKLIKSVREYHEEYEVPLVGIKEYPKEHEAPHEYQHHGQEDLYRHNDKYYRHHGKSHKKHSLIKLLGEIFD